MQNIPCHFYHMGNCKRGKGCYFSHAGKPHGICTNKDSCSIAHYEVPCPLYQQGHCKFGKSCDFRHEIKDLPQQDEWDKDRSPRHRKSKKRQKKSYSRSYSISRSDSRQKQKYIKNKSKSKSKSRSRSRQRSRQKSRSNRQQKEKKSYNYPYNKQDNERNNKDFDNNNKREYEEQQNRGEHEEKIKVNNQPDNLMQINKEDDKTQQVQTTANIDFSQRIQDINQDLQIFKNFEDKINKKPSVDIMFIMDCSSYMNQWMQTCKKELMRIIDFIKKQNNVSQIRISAIGYKDYQENEPQVYVKEFTENIEQIQDFIDSISKSNEGEKTPKDIAGAFDQALKQQWTANCRYCLLLADAPCHGSKYHNDKDPFSSGDPQNRDLETQIIEFANLNISFYAVQITQRTNQMLSILSMAYQQISHKPIGLGDLGNSINALGLFITSTLSETIGQICLNYQYSIFKKALQIVKEQKDSNEQVSLVDKMDQIIVQTEKMFEQKNGSDGMQIQQNVQQQMNYDSYIEQISTGNTFQAKSWAYFIAKEKNKKINWRKLNIQDCELTTSITINSQPFTQDSKFIAFYARDNLLNQQLIVKIPIQIDEKFSIEHLKKEQECKFICQYLVNDFNDRIIKIVPDTRLIINFNQSIIYEIINDNSNNNQNKIYLAEQLVKNQYEKYNNNLIWNNQNVIESSLIAQTFSHYTWQVTQGYLMIVDLLGVTGYITQPLIHCLDESKFGQLNKGYEGIMKFFLTHQCNDYCKKLKLLNPKEQGIIPDNFNIYEDLVKEPTDPSEYIYTLCDLCRKPYQENIQLIYQRYISSQEKYCRNCENERRNSIKEDKCISCGNNFFSSQYSFLMKHTDFPIRCSKCRKERRVKMRKEQEENN